MRILINPGGLLRGNALGGVLSRRRQKLKEGWVCLWNDLYLGFYRFSCFYLLLPNLVLGLTQITSHFQLERALFFVFLKFSELQCVSFSPGPSVLDHSSWWLDREFTYEVQVTLKLWLDKESNSLCLYTQRWKGVREGIIIQTYR